MSTTIRNGTPTPPGAHLVRAQPGNMLAAGLAKAVGTFFLIYTGTATAGAGATWATFAPSSVTRPTSAPPSPLTGSPTPARSSSKP